MTDNETSILLAGVASKPTAPSSHTEQLAGRIEFLKGHMKKLKASEIVTIQDLFFYIATHRSAYVFAGMALNRVREGRLYKRAKTDTDTDWALKCGECIGLDVIISAATKRKMETITPLGIQSAVITLSNWEAEARR